MSTPHPATNAPLCVAALYRFARLGDPAALRQPLLDLCHRHAVKGTLLLAGEGINGTIAGSREGIGAVLDHIRALPGCADLDVKFSGAAQMPFQRMKVRLKREIVTMGVGDLDPAANAGHYLDPHEWNALIADPDVVVIDTRNDYEVAIGSFARAVDPATASFRQFPQWFRDHRDALLGEGRQPKVAMYCTGGIRCEKSTAFLKAEGVDHVYHLKGGILRYLEDMPQEESLWCGECFVFDERVSVGHGLAPGSHTMCRPCGHPLSEADRESELYEEGVGCPHCQGERAEAG